uniref:Putative 15-hydroxyprostaglandin dehydrogenase n=1 Tax=Lutzomyia longipalpis TaxID=7200 RepID=A0A1B0CHV3_LUTLO
MVFPWGNSALVTGATGGVGQAICEQFLKYGIEDLAVVDLSAKEPSIVGKWRQKYSNTSITYFSVDVSCQDDLQRCYETFVKGIKSLDIVVNCAGIFNENHPRKMVEVNLCGTIGSTLLAMEYMRVNGAKGRGGVVVNISSIAGILPMSRAPTYSATKHAIVAFTRSLALGHNDKGIRFLTLCPGGVLTPLLLSMKFLDLKTIELFKIFKTFRIQ